MRRPALILLLISSMAIADEKHVTRGVEFARVNDEPLRLDLYRPTGGDLTQAAATPLIVWVHGGAWRAGDRSSMPLPALVAKGYAVASIDYRLTTSAPFPANIHDIKAAIRFLRANAKKYEIDADRIVVAGASAGGHLAALAGLTLGNPELEGKVGEHLQTSSAVRAIVSFFGASNLTTILSQSTPHGLSVRVPALQLLLEGSPDEKPVLAKLASPVFQLDAKDPPVLLFHGDEDKQMPIEQAQELKRACDAAGIRCESYVVKGAGHGGKGFFDQAMIDQVDQFLHAALRAKR